MRVLPRFYGHFREVCEDQSAARVTGRVRRLVQEDRRRQLVAGFAIAGDRRTSDAYARPLR